MSDLDLDLEAIQRVVDLGPYRLIRCKACRGINLAGASVQCGWCREAIPGAGRRAAAASRGRGDRRHPSPSKAGGQPRRQPATPRARSPRSR